MALLTGTITGKNLAENEEFSYEWNIPKFKDGNSYRSPNFGSICKEFSDCHLEIRTSFFLQNKMTIFLCSSEALNGCKFTFTADVTEGMYPLPNIYCSTNWLDFKPPVKIFEIESYRTRRTFSNRFTFRLDLKLRKDDAPSSSISNSKIHLHAPKKKKKKTITIGMLNQESNTTRGILFSKASNHNVHRSVEEKYRFPLPLDPSSPDGTTSKLHHADNKEPNTAEGIRYSKEFIQDGRSLYTSDIEEKGKSSLPLHQSPSDQTISELFQHDKEELENKQQLVYPKELIQDLRSLYNSEHMCDLEIRIDKIILRAHKLILCARSPVFKAMMEYDCLESSSNSISITDCPASQFETFLKYLYTGEIEDKTVDTVMTLYSLSDKYNVPALRDACSNILHNKLSSKSVDDIANIACDVLQLADCHNDSKLKDLAASFISSHFSVVSNKQSWKDMMKSNFELTSEILALVVNICQKIQT